MKPLFSTTFHGVLSYLIGILLMASPWLFNFYMLGGAALFIPQYFGALLLILTLFSKSPAGAVRQAPVELYLTLAVIVGFIILVSPFLYGFAFAKNGVFLPHLILGLILFISGIVTQGSPFTQQYEIKHRGYGYEGEESW